MPSLDKRLYRAQAVSTGGGREAGHSRTDDGRLEVDLSTPKEMGGTGGEGTNPEQLFAAGYSACFLGAIRAVAGKEKTELPADTSVTAHIGFGTVGQVFGIDAQLDISLPGMDRAAAQALADKAHALCPYSNATRGNVDVVLNIV